MIFLLCFDFVMMYCLRQFDRCFLSVISSCHSERSRRARNLLNIYFLTFVALSATLGMTNSDMLMKRYFIQLSYNGTAYHGWQVQENTVLTIQQVINEMLSKLLNEGVTVMGCGRTDTGVHATDYYAHFDTSVDLLADEAKWIFKFNHALPADIAIHKILKVKETANARFDAVARTYQYVINRKKDPFRINSSCFVYGDLNMDEMNKASKVLFDYSDFSAFAKSNTQTGSNICKL